MSNLQNIVSIEEIVLINHFSNQKNDDIFYITDQIQVKKVRFLM